MIKTWCCLNDWNTLVVHMCGKVHVTPPSLDFRICRHVLSKHFPLKSGFIYILFWFLCTTYIAFVMYMLSGKYICMPQSYTTERNFLNRYMHYIPIGVKEHSKLKLQLYCTLFYFVARFYNGFILQTISTATF